METTNFKYNRIFILLLWCVFFSFNLFAQNEIKSLPVQFGQYMRSYPLINPAAAGAYAKMELNTGIQKHGGNWSTISTYYLNANFRITKDLKTTALPPPQEDEEEPSESDTTHTEEPETSTLPTRFHVAGLSLTGDQEGSFLNRTGVYGVYAWHTKIRPTVFISAGASIGIKNYAVDESYVNGGGSSFAPDGNMGLYLYSTKYSLGLSANQIFNGKLAPLREVTRLIPHLNLMGSRTWEISRFFSVKPSVLVRFAPNYATDVTVYASTLLQDILSASIGYRYQRGATAIVGLEKIKIGNHFIKASFSYYFPIGNSKQLNINTYEITLNYFLKPNVKGHGSIFQ